MKKNKLIQKNNINVAILAGGFGTRLKTLFPDIPKALVPINKKPFLSYIFDHLISFKITNVNLLVGYKAEKIIQFYGNKYKSISIKYIIEDDPLGTGGAIKNFAQKTNFFGYSLIINGDTYFEFNIYNFLESTPKNFDAIVCTKVLNSSRYGSIIINRNNLIKKFKEKSFQREGLINAGVYYLNLEKLYNYPKSKFSLEIEYFDDSLNKGSDIYGHFDPSLFIDIGVPNDYKKASEILR